MLEYVRSLLIDSVADVVGLHAWGSQTGQRSGRHLCCQCAVRRLVFLSVCLSADVVMDRMQLSYASHINTVLALIVSLAVICPLSSSLYFLPLASRISMHF